MIDLYGQTFGRLFAIEPIRKNKDYTWTWWCHCECGDFAEVRGSDLLSGHTQSCGCLQREKTSKANKVHMESHTKLYYIWNEMKQRCRNTNDQRYSRYGARGIEVCPAWNTFATFKTWAEANGYTEGLSIDRINNDKGYAPDNCQWVTRSENSKRRVKNAR